LGGAETIVHRVSKFLVEQGHEVQVFTSDLIAGDGRRYQSEYKDHEVDGIRVRRFRAYQPLRLDASGILPKMLWSLYREQGVDLVHAHGYAYFSSYAPCFVRLFRSTPLIFSPYYSDTTSAPFVQRVYDATLGWLSFVVPDHFVALADSEKAALMRKYDLPEYKFSIVPPGVDVEELHKPQSGVMFRKKYGIAQDMVLFVGRIAYTKGLLFLVKAIPSIVQKCPQCQFVFVGPDWGATNGLLALAEDLGIKKYLLFTGPLNGDDFVGAYNAAGIFVHPSVTSEAYGIAVVEAMAAGKPVVATNVGARADIVTEGRNGFLVPAGNSEVLAERILRLLTDKDMVTHMGRTNIEDAQKYRWQEVNRRMEEIYRQVTERT
jgi:glycosyltransferase involved in cell wall biosynthesis